MARKQKQRRTRRQAQGTLQELRKQAEDVWKRLQTAGRRQIRNIEKQIRKLNHQREAILNELGAAMSRAGGATRRGRATRAGAVRGGRRRRRVDWNKVYGRLPKGPFSAGDVRKLAPSVAAGTLSQRLTGWVKERKLRRTGSRRGTRYTKLS